MAFGAFAVFSSTQLGWKMPGTPSSWRAQRTLIGNLNHGTSPQENTSFLRIYGGLFMSHEKDATIQVHVFATTGQIRPHFTRTAVVPSIGDVETLVPIPSPALEIAFQGNRDNNSWAIEIVCDGLDKPGSQKIPRVEGWFRGAIMISQ